MARVLNVAGAVAASVLLLLILGWLVLSSYAKAQVGQIVTWPPKAIVGGAPPPSYTPSTTWTDAGAHYNSANQTVWTDNGSHHE